jgi:hypothetical protein
MPFSKIVEFYGSMSPNINEIILAAFFALLILLVGIFLGKLIGGILKKIAEKTEVEKEIRPSFIKLIIVVIKWSIYIVFINLALNQFPIEGLSDIIVSVLLVIPAFIAALVLIGIGFAIAIYLRDVVEDSEITGWKTLSQYLYYFVLYVAGVYALNLALISIDPLIRNILVVSLTIVIGAAVAFRLSRKESHAH